MRFSARTVCLAATALLGAVPEILAQRGAPPDPNLVARRDSIERALEAIAIVDRKLMIPMRDGLRMATDVYRPKDTSKKVPVVFVRTPYNFNFWDVRLGAPRDMTAELEAVQRGYAYVEMNERGHFFSEGNYDILGPPLTDGYDAIKWMSSQPTHEARGMRHAFGPRRALRRGATRFRRRTSLATPAA